MGNEYEPDDSRNVTGTAHTRDGRWSGGKQTAAKGGEYEPRDSRNVTGAAKSPDGRWTNKGKQDVPGVPDSHPFTAEEAARSPEKRNDDDEKGGTAGNSASKEI